MFKARNFSLSSRLLLSLSACSSFFSNHCKPHVFKSTSPYRQKGGMFGWFGGLWTLCKWCYCYPRSCKRSQRILQTGHLFWPGLLPVHSKLLPGRLQEADAELERSGWSGRSPCWIDWCCCFFFPTRKDLATCWSILFIIFLVLLSFWSAETLGMSASAVRSVQVTCTSWLLKEITDGGYYPVPINLSCCRFLWST